VEIEDKVAVVTGAGSRIGRAVARRLAHEGAAIVVADVDEDAGASAVREIHSEGGRAAFVLVDVAAETNVEKMVAFAEGVFGGLDVLVNNAGGVTEPYFPESEPEYGAAKAGVVRLTASLATLKEQMGVRVNCICPGWVDTPASRRSRAQMTPEEREKSVPSILLQPEEIAEAVVIFVEDETMTGRVMIWQEGEPWQIVPSDAPY